MMRAVALFSSGRRILLCSPDRLVCPSCGGLIRRLTIGDGGASWTQCEHRRRLSGGRRTVRECGQYMLIAGRNATGIVTPVTRSEYNTFWQLRPSPSAETIYSALGLGELTDLLEHMEMVKRLSRERSALNAGA
jgi:hypothetical protein